MIARLAFLLLLLLPAIGFTAEPGELSGVPPAGTAGQEVKVGLKRGIAGAGTDTQKFIVHVER